MRASCFPVYCGLLSNILDSVHQEPVRHSPLTVTIKKCLYSTVPQKTKLRITEFNDSTFGYTPKKTESRDSRKYLQTSVHSNMIHDSQKVEAIHMPNCGLHIQLNVIQPEKKKMKFGCKVQHDWDLNVLWDVTEDKCQKKQNTSIV